MDWNEVRGLITAAVEDLVRRDVALLRNDANERSISHRLALHLQGRFPDWDVDCEYNRMENRDSPNAESNAAKRLAALYDESVLLSDPRGKTVFPDIIVHKRGPDGPNLLVLEMKKAGCDGEAVELDHKKLRAYVHEFRYSFGVFLAWISTDRG